MESHEHQIYKTVKNLMHKKGGENEVKQWIRDLKSDLQDVETSYQIVKDEMFDWSIYVTQAKKRFSDLDIAILEALLIDEGYCLTYRGIEYRLSESDHYLSLKLPPTAIPLIRRRNRRLMRMGLVQMRTGLWSEDGMPAGSGFEIQPSRYSTVQQIINVYRHENLKLDI